MPPSITFADTDENDCWAVRSCNCSLTFFHSIYCISIHLPLPHSSLHPSIHPCPRVRQGSIFKSTKSTTPGQTNEKEDGERNVERGQDSDGVKLLRDAQTQPRGGTEKLPQITKDNKGAIRSFCLVTFIVSPVLMTNKLPPTSQLLSNPPPRPTPLRTLSAKQ